MKDKIKGTIKSRNRDEWVVCYKSLYGDFKSMLPDDSMKILLIGAVIGFVGVFLFKQIFLLAILVALVAFGIWVLADEANKNTAADKTAPVDSTAKENHAGNSKSEPVVKAEPIVKKEAVKTPSQNEVKSDSPMKGTALKGTDAKEKPVKTTSSKTAAKKTTTKKTTTKKATDKKAPTASTTVAKGKDASKEKAISKERAISKESAVAKKPAKKTPRKTT